MKTRVASFRRTLARRSAPLLFALVGVTAVSAPTAYYVVRVSELRHQGKIFAQNLATRLQTEARRRPFLWRYDSQKAVEYIRAFRLHNELAEVRIYDAQRRLMTSRSSTSAPVASLDRPVAWSVASIEVESQGVGSVWVAMSLRSARVVAAGLVLPFLVLGLLLAAFLYFLPQRALKEAERQIHLLVGELQESRIELTALNQDLERQVQDRVRELQTAYDDLQSNDARLRQLVSNAAVVQDADRRALGRDLHDAAGQVLTAIRLSLQLLQRKRGSPEEIDRISRSALAQVDQVMEEVRRVVAALGPAVVSELGLVESLRRHCEDIASQVPFELATSLTDPPVALSPAHETACYRIAQEALTNVIRHARATSVTLGLECSTSDIVLRVSDNGCGFSSDLLEKPGHGRSFMQERVELLGGHFLMRSQEGQGTTLVATFPLKNVAAKNEATTATRSA